MPCTQLPLQYKQTSNSYPTFFLCLPNQINTLFNSLTVPQIKNNTLEQLPWLTLISKSPRPEDDIDCKTYSMLFSAHAIASTPSNSMPFLSACFTVIVGSNLPSTSYFLAFKQRNQVETINYLGKKDRNKPQRGGCLVPRTLTCRGLLNLHGDLLWKAQPAKPL